MKRGKRLWFALLVVWLAAGSICAAAQEERIEEGVYISDIDVSGMTRNEAQKAVAGRIEQIRSSKITVQVGEDSVEATASDLGLQWDNKDVVEDAIDLGNSGNAIRRYKDKKDLTQGQQVIPFVFSANANAVRTFIEDQCMQFEKEAQEITVSADGSGGIDIQPGVTGQAINVDASVQAVQEYISGQYQGGEGNVALVVELDEPEGSDQDLESIQDLLGTATTYYGDAYGRNLNVERGAELINNHIVLPGETFSVCDHLVPFNAENGYELANEYAMGKVVQGYGGGICQVSTTLYNALLQAELEIVERHCHTMTVNYVEPSMDAAIAEGAMDLVFRNNLDTPILISGYAYGGELTFSVWGKETRPAGREVYYYSVTTSETPSGGTQLFAAPDQPVGYFQLVNSGMSGLTAECYKVVTYNGQTTEEQVNSSVYEATPVQYEVGTLGATDAFLSAVYSNDLATAQALAAGILNPTPQTTAETPASETVASETNAAETTDPQTTVPEVQVPQTTAPEVQIPQTTVPDATGGDVWIPEDTVPEAAGDVMVIP